VKEGIGVNRIARVVSALGIVGLMLVTTGTSDPRASAQEPAASPARLVHQIDSGIFTAQSQLLLGKSDAAAAGIEQSETALALIVPMLTADPAIGGELGRYLDDARTAVERNDNAALAIAKGQLSTGLLRASYRETIAAVQSGDFDSAGAWLLVREYRPTTKFSGPDAKATIALASLRDGDITTEDAMTSISADLLDAYQGQLDTAVADAAQAAKSGYAVSQAEDAARANGYWQIVAPAYATQNGVEARARVDQTFSNLVTASIDADTATFQTSVTGAQDVLAQFRAAPMTAVEQSERAHQLIQFLGLIPVEYKRGVSGTTVQVPLEIEEAKAFSEAAGAAFADIRPTLNQLDPAVTSQIAESIAALDEQVADARSKTNVVETGVIEQAVKTLEDQLRSIYPQEWNESSSTADFDVVSTLLDQVLAAAAAGQYQQAESARLQAYAVFESGPEKHLLGFAPRVAQETEALFWTGGGDTRGLQVALADHASVDEIQGILAELQTTLDEGKQRLGADRPGDASIIFNSATIVFREGLEGILILASLLASMIGANKIFKKPLVVGAAGAFLATAVLFFLARTVLLSLNQYGEKLEAIVSLVAIGVLLIVMNWFFHKVYWTKWIAHHHQKRRMLIGGAAGQFLGLAILGFTSVFREGAETVLFLQAMVLDAGTLVVLEGVALGLVGVAIVGALVFYLQAKLPHKKMLIITGFMIALVLVTMVGNTVHVLQVVGWAPITPIENLVLPYWTGVWLGLYATWEGIIAQVIAVVFVVGSYFAAEWSHDRSQRAKLEASMANQSGVSHTPSLS
jgi:high-affinity iron transporter